MLDPISDESLRPGPPSVLVIEDDPASRRFYSYALQQDGFIVVEAHNGYQAIEKASEVRPDLIVTDLAIPGIDGFELCRRLNRHADLSGVPILAITGRYLAPADVQRALREGCRAVLFKPIGADVLTAEVRKLLPGS